MFSLVPILLLIAFQGPSALERFGHGDRLPEALRAWERVLATAKASGQVDESALEGRGLDRAGEALARWASLSSDAALSVAIAHFLNLDVPESAAPHHESPITTGVVAQPLAAAEGGPSAGLRGERFLQCRRNRAGPARA